MGLRMDIVAVFLTFVHVVRKLVFSEMALQDDDQLLNKASHSESVIKNKMGKLGQSSLFFLVLTLLFLSMSPVALG
jgi:hypothetical protein